MATETKTTVVKVRPSNQDGSSKGKIDPSLNKKKIESSSSRLIGDSKQKSVVIKSEVKSKSTPGSSNTKPTTSTPTKTREKKVYTFAGQKYDPPEQREPLRIFYESLSKQIPTSEMAEFWMMEHGLLSPERARKAYEKKQRRQKEIRMGTPIKTSKPPTKPETAKQQQASKNGDIKAKKKTMDYSDDDDNFFLSAKRRKD